MRPVPVPEKIREQDWVRGTRVFAAPDGDLLNERIPPAEGVFFFMNDEGQYIPCVGVIIFIEDEDVELIKQGNRHVLLAWPGERMPVFLVPQIVGQD